MKQRYIVDTNVLIAASAGDPSNIRGIDATPEDPGQRKIVWEWVNRFIESESNMVLDKGLKIYDEYINKLTFNDYGIQAVMRKWDKAQVDNVDIGYDENGNGKIPETLESVVHDLADRKMVAAAIASKTLYDEGCIAFAGDTDWHEWENDLLGHEILLEPIIEDWSRAKFREKQARKAGN